jgi:hypothetical protein
VRELLADRFGIRIVSLGIDVLPGKDRALLLIVRLRGIIDDVVPPDGFNQDGPVAFR